MTAIPPRQQRFHPGDRPDQRTEFQRDRDRILYCSAFRRLAEVTQVVSAAEGHSFHNRLTHSLKVAQIARRLAEKLVADQPTEATELGGPEPEVAEAAALAHDLGHPPFGHIAEEELNLLAKESEEEDGFEGNAQSFRIITKLAVRSPVYSGLNLTSATLNAVLKYPWYRAERGEYRRKWGVYPTERPEFEWARNVSGLPREIRSVEAELMDWADDIAYSVFDVDDFYRGGLIPLHQLFSDRTERDRFLAGATERLTRWKKDATAITDAFRELMNSFPPVSLKGDFQGTTEQRAFLREWTSKLVARYVNGIKLRVPVTAAERCVEISPDLKNEVESLKQLVWHYVIENQRLLTQQHGERTVIRTLFTLFREKAEKGDVDMFAEPYRQELKKSIAAGQLKQDHIRIVIDMISGMTENQALRLHHRLAGVSIGSIHDHM